MRERERILFLKTVCSCLLQNRKIGCLKRDYALQNCECIYLTNRSHVAVRLFGNRSQMTSTCGKNKKVAHEVQPFI